MTLQERIQQAAAIAAQNRAGGIPPATTQAPLPVVTTPAPVTAPAPAAAPSDIPLPVAGGAEPQRAPWAEPTCVACSGSGFNSKGGPCRNCDVAAVRTKARFHSGNFKIEPLGDGLMFWEFTANKEINGISPLASTAPVTSDVRTQAPAPVQTPVTAPVATPPAPVVTAPTPGPVVQTPPAQVAASVDKKTRAKKGFTLVINASVSVGQLAPKVTRLVDAFRDMQLELEKAAGKPYHEMDAFRRRDIAAGVAEAIAEKFGTDHVVADLANGTPDLRAFCEAIRPFAMYEVVGTTN